MLSYGTLEIRHWLWEEDWKGANAIRAKFLPTLQTCIDVKSVVLATCG